MKTRNLQHISFLTCIFSLLLSSCFLSPHVLGASVINLVIKNRLSCRNWARIHKSIESSSIFLINYTRHSHLLCPKNAVHASKYILVNLLKLSVKYHPIRLRKPIPLKDRTGDVIKIIRVPQAIYFLM